MTTHTARITPTFPDCDTHFTVNAFSSSFSSSPSRIYLTFLSSFSFLTVLGLPVPLLYNCKAKWLAPPLVVQVFSYRRASHPKWQPCLATSITLFTHLMSSFLYDDDLLFLLESRIWLAFNYKFLLSILASWAYVASFDVVVLIRTSWVKVSPFCCNFRLNSWDTHPMGFRGYTKTH